MFFSLTYTQYVGRLLIEIENTFNGTCRVKEHTSGVQNVFSLDIVKNHRIHTRQFTYPFLSGTLDVCSFNL